MPIRRLEAEAIRDAVLGVSGRLDLRMYGPSIPVHLTEFMQGRGRPETSGPLDGAGRRSIYTAVRRNFLSPMMRAFDAPQPFSTVGRRSVSNVPAQALIMMNDPLIAEQSRLWARRLLSRHATDYSAAIVDIYETAFSRPPQQAEADAAYAFLVDQGRQWQLAPEEAIQDERVWADLCHVIMNVKEFIFIR
jgi:hypothetical protein